MAEFCTSANYLRKRNALAQVSAFTGFFIAALIDVPCDELRELIDSSFDNGLVDDFIVSKKCVALAFEPDSSRFQHFAERLHTIENFTDTLRHWASFRPPPPKKPVSSRHPNPIPRPNITSARPASSDVEITSPKPIVEAEPRVGRNSPCPCGSGKKYKKCCMRHEKSAT